MRTTCRCCGSKDLEDLFSLGEHRVNDFRADWTNAPKCEIALQLCRACTLVQQKYTAPQDWKAHYWYRSGATVTMRRALSEIADAAMERVQLQPGDVVLDIGSNDGTLLRAYPKELDLTTIGVEPAENLAAEGRRGVSVHIQDLWGGVAVPLSMSAGKPKVVTAIGMFYDLEDPNQFIADVAKVLHPKGVFIAQLMCAKQMCALKDVGNLAHEHLEFYTLRSLQSMFYSHGLDIFDVEENDVNGGSYRLFVQHLRRYTRNTTARCQEAFYSERDLSHAQRWHDWWYDVAANLNALKAFCKWAKKESKSIWVYGASTKGNTILQAAGLGNDLIDCAADISQEKWGKHTSTGIPIASCSSFRDAQPDFAIVLPYAFIDEFVQKEDLWIARGGKFVVPIPELRFV